MFENPSSLFPMVRFVPYMGVIWTIHEASSLVLQWASGMVQCRSGAARGRRDHGAPPRINSVSLEEPIDAAYGPVRNPGGSSCGR